MGAFLEKPRTDKLIESGAGNGLRYAVACMQGWRVDMEDAHTARIDLGNHDDGDQQQENRLQDWSYFAVFDGHAGARVSAHCAAHLLDAIVTSDEFHEDVCKGIHNGFLQLDKSMRALPVFASGEDKSGSTVVCAFISPSAIYVANCGDSRAVLSRNDGSSPFATQDHKPHLPAERDRIVRAGGSVMIQRVNGSLAVSRALGDFEYKNVDGRTACEQLVSPEPEIFARERDHAADEFLVLACDGIWDVMTNEELCQFIRHRLRITDDLRAVAGHIVDTCLCKGSRDNLSIVLVVFPAAPKPTPEAIAADRELDDTIETRMREICESMHVEQFSDVLYKLLALNIEGLPPGAGLAAKRSLIEEIFKLLCPDKQESIYWCYDIN